MTDCEHGSPAGACPVCDAATPTDPSLSVRAERLAGYDGPCVLDCPDRIEVGDPIALLADGDDPVGWAHLDCAAEAIV